VTTRAVARRRRAGTPDLDAAIAEAEAGAIVIWRGERIGFAGLPERIARTDERELRDRLYAAYIDAVEALNPLYQRRLAAWKVNGDPVEAAARTGRDPRALATELERLALHTETPYYAALRRYLALIGIEQGDATEADLWHVVRGSEWDGWFATREVDRAVTAAGRAPVDVGDLTGWRAAERRLAAPSALPEAEASVVGRAYATLAGSLEWLVDELNVSADEAVAFVDFATFVRLWRIRRLTGELMLELRLYGEDDPALLREYHRGILSSLTGVAVSEAGYLVGIDSPLASARALEATLLAAMVVEVLEQRHGTRWWHDPAASDLVSRIDHSTDHKDVLAELGYDALDWRPVLRQIRTRLIGEMSGYGGPNITTRAGTRKV
jgi:hypothetical protein